MASKRSKLELLESPPSASPSSSHEDDEEESSSEEVTPQPKPAAQKPQSSSSGDSGSGSESESEPEETPRSVPEPVVKPQAVDQAANKKPRSKPTPTPKATAPKRPAEAEREKEPKKAKKAADGGSKGSEKRLWSEEEEIALLKGMIDYEEKIGLSPSEDMEAFHAFVKKSLYTDASRSQLYEKLRRIKKKYWDNVEKLKKEGTTNSSLKPHDKKLFELSKKIWRNEANGLQSPNKTDKVKSAGKPKKNENQSVTKPTPKLPPKKLEASLTPSVDDPKDVEETETETEPQRNLVPLTSLADNQRDLAPFMSLAVGKSRGDIQDYVIEEGLKLVKGPQRAELEDRRAKLQTIKLELCVERSKLIHEQAKVVLEEAKKLAQG